MTSTATGIGPLLREWREARRLSQLALSSAAGVSTRHLSCVETGRSSPSPELVLHLAEHLDVPLRFRNEMLLAAGYAPIFRERPLDDPLMAPVASVLDSVLERSEPNPTVIVDGSWNLLRANAPAFWLCSEVDPMLLEPPANVVRLSVHEAGLRPHITNFEEYAGHLADRVRSASAARRTPELATLADELDDLVGRAPGPSAGELAFAVPMCIEVEGRTLALFSTLSTFGTAVDVGVSELSIETFYPADDATARLLSSHPWR